MYARSRSDVASAHPDTDGSAAVPSATAWPPFGGRTASVLVDPDASAHVSVAPSASSATRPGHPSNEHGCDPTFVKTRSNAVASGVDRSGRSR